MIAIVLLFVLSLHALIPFTAHAHDFESKKVRVGWYESAFHTTDQFGRRSGFGYEYQQRLKAVRARSTLWFRSIKLSHSVPPISA